MTDVELFVAVLGASNYAFAEATRTQQVGDFVASVARALMFFGGVPRAIVPDQLKSAVIKACRYDPEVSRILGWAEQVGPSVRALCEVILRERRHPEWGHRSCLGLFRVTKKYGNARVDAASRRALYAGARSYRPVLTILEHDLDRQPLPEPAAPASTGPTHAEASRCSGGESDPHPINMKSCRPTKIVQRLIRQRPGVCRRRPALCS